MCVLIDRLQQKHPIKTVCQVLDMPRSTYYQAKSACESSLARENRELMQRIQDLYTGSKRIYGAPKIQKRLRKEGSRVSLKRVQRLMRRANLRSIIVKKYRPQSSKGPVENRRNVLAQDFTATKINQKWVADITYIHTVKEGWCYLASVMDLCTRKIIGYSFSRSMTTELALRALDNACIESFHATLKKEEIHQTTYKDFDEARRALFQYIEGWYNRARIHSVLDYLTPQEAEDKFLKTARSTHAARAPLDMERRAL